MISPFRQIDPNQDLLDLIKLLNDQFQEIFENFQDGSPAPVFTALSVKAITRSSEEASLNKIIKWVNSNYDYLGDFSDYVATRLDIGPLHRISLESAITEIERVCNYNFPFFFEDDVDGDGGDLPEAPEGFAYLVNAGGKYIVNADDAYILVKV